MKFIDEFREPDKARRLVDEIGRQMEAISSRLPMPLRIMEFCGGHTHTIFRYGLEQMLPSGIELVHGPGCPVCVLPMERVDDAVALAQRPGVIFTTFGDAMRVPGTRQSLSQARAEGADIRMVYSPLDALDLARRNPQHEVIFFALGFETTMPTTALTVLQAENEGIDNFSLFCNHVTTPPILHHLLEDAELGLDGFIAPGHVGMVVGADAFGFVAREHGKPMVISGFEPLDILQSLWMLIRQIGDGRCEIENQYARIVKDKGNPAALAAMSRVFEIDDDFEWPGPGSVGSGVHLREAFARFDSERRFAGLEYRHDTPHPGPCGSVLMGAIPPWECKMFGDPCTPLTPQGALMVSSEGACAACYDHHKTPNREHARR